MEASVIGPKWRSRKRIAQTLALAFKSVASSKTLSGIEGQRRHKLIALAGQRPALQDLIVGRRAEAIL